MTNTRHNLRDIYPPTGTEITTKSWLTEAPMRMLMNNLHPDVAENPHELVVYGGIGRAARTWEDFDRIIAGLKDLEADETLVVQSGKPVAIVRTHVDAPRVLIANSNIVPHWAHWDHFNELDKKGLMMYGQMTAGSYMYIGPQGIVHGTTLTILNAARKYLNFDTKDGLGGLLYVTSGLGGMSGAQAKAAVITGAVSVIADSNSHAAKKRYEQGWLSELFDDLDKLIVRLRVCLANKEAVSLGYMGNIIDVWERLNYENIIPDLGSDQTSLHNPWLGGYTPYAMTYDEMKKMISDNPE